MCDERLPYHKIGETSVTALLWLPECFLQSTEKSLVVVVCTINAAAYNRVQVFQECPAGTGISLFIKAGYSAFCETSKLPQISS